MKKPKTKHQAYGEAKKRATFSLTPTVLDLVKEEAKRLKLSQSEVVERMLRAGDQELLELEETRLLGESCAG